MSNLENDDEVEHFVCNKKVQVTSSYISCSIVLQGIGVAYVAKDIYVHFDEICMFLKLVLIGMTIWGGSFCIVGFGVTALRGLYNYNMLNLEVESSSEEDDDYEHFIQADLDTLANILDPANDKLEQYQNKDEDFLKDLKKPEHHLCSVLPYKYLTNPTIMMYYDSDDEAFHYYSKNCDIQYKVLNSICRSYVINRCCVQLYQDENDLNDISCKNTESDSDSSENEPDKEYEKIDNNDMQPRSNSLFYRKKTRKDMEEEKKEESSFKDKTINKFIYKGNMCDYENSIRNEKPEVQQNVDYNTFKKVQEESNL